MSAPAVAMVVLLIASGCGDGDSGDWMPEADSAGTASVDQMHHRPDHLRGQSRNHRSNGKHHHKGKHWHDKGGSEDGGGDENGADNPDDNPSITRCSTDSECESHEACSQGGRCIDVTGQESVTEALQADIDELPEAVGLGVPYELPPNSILRLNGINDNDVDNDNADAPQKVGLLIENGIILEGNGSRILADNDTVAIRLGDDSDWSRVSNLWIDPINMGQVHSGIGIDVRSHGVRLENLMIRRMGTGIRAHTHVDDLGHANVNGQQWSRIVLANNYEHGLHIRSGDSNAGLFMGVEILGGGGIRDDSFLGNTYIAPKIHNDGNQHESMMRTRNAGASTVLGMYLEDVSADPVSEAPYDLHVGGNAIHRTQTQGDRIGRHHSRIRFANDRGVRMRIPGGGHEPFAFSHPDDGQEWRLKYFPSWREWGMSLQGSTPLAYSWTGVQHPDGPGLFVPVEELRDSLWAIFDALFDAVEENYE